jgi:3',5'-cyclic AMP phosphodiesterase CpdA
MNPMFKSARRAFAQHPYLNGLAAIFLGGLLIFSYWYYFERIPATDWNTTNLKKIRIRDPNNFAFAIFGDNKENGRVFEALLKQVQQEPDIAFAVDSGDLVRHGDEPNFRFFINEITAHLTCPLLTVIGNHDLGEGGRGLYQTIFNPVYYSFRAGRNCLIILDDADRLGLDSKQLAWLEQELIKSQDCAQRFIFLHVPLFDPRLDSKRPHCMNRRMANRLLALFNKYHVSHIFAGHLHGYYSGQWQGIPFTISAGAGAEFPGADPRHDFYNYLVVRIKEGSCSIKVKQVSQPINLKTAADDGESP